MDGSSVGGTADVVREAAVTLPVPRRPGFWTLLRETFDFIRVGLIPGGADPRPLYALLEPHNLVGEASRFINLGYWADRSTVGLDAGARALADVLASAAQLGTARSVVDVGFGYG